MTPTNNEHLCQYEEQIQAQGRKLERLETRADYKGKMLDEINHKMDKMQQKVDELSENVNKLILQSIQQDNQLELRLTRIETDMENQKIESQQRMVWIGLALTTITLLINLYFHIVK